MTHDQERLRDYMSECSQDLYFAGWMNHLWLAEHRLVRGS